MRENSRRPEIKKMHPGKRRVLLVSIVFVYICCFHWIYVHYLNSEVAHFGFLYEPPQFGFVALGWILALAPSLWMPLLLKRASQLAYWILYVVVVIPSMLVPVYADVLTVGQNIAVMLTLFLGFAITGLSYTLPLFRIRNKMMPPSSFKYLVIGCLTIAAAWFGYVHRSA